MSSGRELTPAERENLRQGLLEADERARQDHAAATRDFDAIVESSAQSNADDEHDPEGSTIAFERAQVRSLMARAQATESAVAQALLRWESGTYGHCEICGVTIGYDRLVARPATSRCIDHAGC